MQKKFNNVLITGASSGIGEAVALYLAAHGVKNLFLSGRNAERLNDVAVRCRALRATVYPQIISVCDKEAMARWIADCNQTAELDLVFANAGVFRGSGQTVVLDSTAQIQMAEEVVTTIAGYHGLPSCPSYSATKACVKAYGEALRGTLKADNIDVSVICPGFVKSRITDKNTCPMPFFMSAEKAAEIIVQRLEKNVGLIAFPWPMRLATWGLSILPNRLTDWLYAALPHKV